jgi:hypothetical protein
VTEAVGPTFEHEARLVLTKVFHDICPWAHDHSALLSRVLDRDGNSREADIMCYVKGDNFEPCRPAAVHGVALATLPAGAEAVALMPAIALPDAVRFSPTDTTHLGPHKYFLAEAYSGAVEERMAAKVLQLETLCDFLKRRWVEQHDHYGAGPVTDITQLVGAVAFVFCAGDAPRRGLLGSCQQLVERHATGANLLRLIRASRLVVVVLDKSQSPSTYFQRAVSTELGQIGAKIDLLLRR